MDTESLATLHINGKSESGLKNAVFVRDLPAFIVDEPERLGGSNSGPNPLEYLLGSLSACTSIIAAYVAKEQNFSYTELDFSTDGTLDTRGFRGVEGVRTYFQTVTVNLEIQTEEDDEALNRLIASVEKRCPIYNLLKDAGVKVETVWSKK